ncbi:acyl carrier protein [bacterium]|nr:acyl carrier protein [bacterium]MDA9173060.1 acyl carrier protein [bacterium]
MLGTEVPTSVPLMSLGLDSIAAVEFTSAISDSLRVSVSAIVLFDHPTLESIGRHLAGELEMGSVEEQ